MGTHQQNRTGGFTLIELSIVLVIIGLIVGGVLMGQNLIATASARAQVTQIEKYNQAVNTFRGKYNYIPGDIPDPDATKFGFAARGQYAGEGDGNGIIEGNWTNTSGGNAGFAAECGENMAFWVDLTFAKMIDGGFTVGTEATPPGNIYATSTPSINAYYPSAKISNGAFVYIYSFNAKNYFGISAVTEIGYGIASTPAITVAQAYAIDKKIDDGLPESGNVLAQYETNAIGFPLWSNGVSAANGTYTTATQGSAATCFDNGFNSSNTMQYSVTQNNGVGTNCGLSFRMQ